MHVHDKNMRTTIEVGEEHRARLLELAARRGQKGFSHLVAEALEFYLRDQQHHDSVARALAQKGALSDREAGELEESVRSLRSHWR